MSTKGHGSYEDVAEGEFIPAVTGSSHCVVHFYHHEFERCRCAAVLCSRSRSERSGDAHIACPQNSGQAPGAACEEVLHHALLQDARAGEAASPPCLVSPTSLSSTLWRPQDAPFFVHKLGIQVLPCVVMFLEGKAR